MEKWSNLDFFVTQEKGAYDLLKTSFNWETLNLSNFFSESPFMLCFVNKFVKYGNNIIQPKSLKVSSEKKLI